MAAEIRWRYVWNEHAGRLSQVIFAWFQRDGVSPAICAEGDELVPCGQLEFQDVIARFPIGEGIVSEFICGSRPNLRTLAVQQVHGDPGHAGLIRILDAILIRVVPDQTAQIRRRDVHAGIGYLIHIARHERDGIGPAICAERGELEVLIFRQSEFHDVIARFQIGEGIISGCIRGGGSNLRPLAVEQVHGDPGHAGLIRILNVVRVGVIPDPTAEIRRLEDATIGCQILIARHERDGLGPAICAR